MLYIVEIFIYVKILGYVITYIGNIYDTFTPPPTLRRISHLRHRRFSVEAASRPGLEAVGGQRTPGQNPTWLNTELWLLFIVSEPTNKHTSSDYFLPGLGDVGWDLPLLHLLPSWLVLLHEQ